MQTKIETRTTEFNFYGTDRFNLPGVHPGERIAERVPFEDQFEVTYTDDGDQYDAQPVGDLNVYARAEAYAKGLLASWSDQSAIQVHECETSKNDDFVVTR